MLSHRLLGTLDFPFSCSPPPYRYSSPFDALTGKSTDISDDALFCSQSFLPVIPLTLPKNIRRTIPSLSKNHAVPHLHRYCPRRLCALLGRFRGPCSASPASGPLASHGGRPPRIEGYFRLSVVVVSHGNRQCVGRYSLTAISVLTWLSFTADLAVGCSGTLNS